MKKLFVALFISLCCLTTIYSQITLSNATHAPQIDDSYELTVADTTGITIDPGSAGANVTWDFSGLISTSKLYSYNVVDVSSTTDGASYPNATIAVQEDTVKYFYYNVGTSVLEYHGSKQFFAIAEAVVPYSDPAKTLEYPFTYNSTLQDGFAASYTIQSIINVEKDGTIDVLADGYGQLILPDETYDNTLRVKTTEFTKDSATIVATQVIIEMAILTYTWYSLDFRHPLLIVSDTITSMDGGSPTEVTSARYYDASSNIPDNVQETSLYLKFFPNPAQNKIYLNYNIISRSHIKLFLYNQIGGKVREIVNKEQQEGNYQLEVNLGNLTKGVYYMQMHSNENVITKKLILN